jgi:hypothetical protein
MNVETRHKIINFAKLTELQWGRILTNTETLQRLEVQQGAQGASMEPHPYVCGNGCWMRS